MHPHPRRRIAPTLASRRVRDLGAVVRSHHGRAGDPPDHGSRAAASSPWLAQPAARARARGGSLTRGPHGATPRLHRRPADRRLRLRLRRDRLRRAPLRRRGRGRALARAARPLHRAARPLAREADRRAVVIRDARRRRKRRPSSTCRPAIPLRSSPLPPEEVFPSLSAPKIRRPRRRGRPEERAGSEHLAYPRPGGREGAAEISGGVARTPDLRRGGSDVSTMDESSVHFSEHPRADRPSHGDGSLETNGCA